MIAKCTCKNEYQDRRYGPGNRIHNLTKKVDGRGQDGKRCTVCGKTTSR